MAAALRRTLAGGLLAASLAGPTQAAAVSLHERALALATRLHWADAPDDHAPDGESAWPHVDFCDAELQRAGCALPRSTLLLRNASELDLQGLRICADRRTAPQLQLLNADAQGCVAGSIAAHGDLALTVQQRPDARSYPSLHALRLVFSLPEWKRGAPLLELSAPILRAPPAQALPSASADDDDFSIGVQERRLTLRSKLVVFTFHGPPSSSALVQARQLVAPDGGLRVLDARTLPGVFARHRLPSCSASAKARGLRVHSLASGRSCGLVVSGSKADTAPFTTVGRTRVDGTLKLRFQVRGGKRQAHVVKQAPLLMQQLLLVGGQFQGAGQVGTYALPVSGLVAVFGGQFHEVPSVMLDEYPDIRSLGLSPDGAQLYFGGQFRRATGPGELAPWSFLGVTNFVDTAVWTPVTGPDGPVFAIAPSGGRVYVGGDFTWLAHDDSPGVGVLLPGDPLQPTADEEHWQPVGEGVYLGAQATTIEAGTVKVIEPAADGRVLIGGKFDWAREAPPAGDQPQRILRVPNLAAWDPQAQAWINFGGVTWTQVPPYAGVLALLPYLGGTLLGGSFERVGQPFGSEPYLLAADALAFYDPGPQGAQQRWRRFLPNLGGFVKALVNTPHGTYLGGRMIVPGGDERVLMRMGGPVGNGALHDLLVDSGGAFDEPGLDPEIEAMASIGDTLCVGGDFERLSNGVEAANLACRNLVTQADELAAQGVDGPVYAMLPIWQMEVEGS